MDDTFRRNQGELDMNGRTDLSWQALSELGWVRVVFSADVDPETDECPGCGGHYPECPCPGPTMDKFEYRESSDGVLMAYRRA